MRYYCWNRACLDSWHWTPTCPYEMRAVAARPLSPARRADLDYLHKLKDQGIISAPLPGTSSTFRWALPWLLILLLPGALFAFFVLTLMFAR